MLSLSQVLQPRHVFGLNTAPREILFYQDDSTIIFPAGHHLVLHNTAQNTQKFIFPAEKSEAITAICIGPSRKHVAVAERTADTPRITIYEIATRKRRKQWSIPGAEPGATAAQGSSTIIPTASKDVVGMAFSPDGKYLVVQSGAPDYILSLWTWEKAKGVGSIAVSHNPVYQVSFNPRDPTHICVSGSGVLKFFRFAEGSLKLAGGGMGKRELQNYPCHAWLPEDRMIVSNDNGDLLLLEGPSFEFRNVLAQSPSDGVPIESICVYSKGFVCGTSSGSLVFFEKSFEKEKDLYRRSRTLRVMDRRSNGDAAVAEAADADVMRVRNICVNTTEETIAIATHNAQVFSLNLSSSEIAKPEDIVFERPLQSFHSDKITGIDVCIRKPLVATCSKDKSVRIWNYQSNTLEVSKTFPVEAHSITLHPSGLHALVGFTDKLRFMNILGDDITEFKAFAIRSCPECRFSHGGQYFAAVHGNIIQIYNTYTCEPIGHALRGHNGKVRSLCWSEDDNRLVSVGQDGAVYEWNVRTSNREFENVIKNSNYMSVVMDGKTVYTVGADTRSGAADSRLKEIVEGTVQGDYRCDPTLTALALASLSRMLVAGASDGSIRAYNLPLVSSAASDGASRFPGASTISEKEKDVVPAPLHELVAHSSQVWKVCISFDESCVFTISDDGVLMSFELHDKEGRTRREILHSEEILIKKADLESRMNEIAEARTKIEDLQNEIDYTIRKKEMEAQEAKHAAEEQLTDVERRYQDRLSSLQREKESDMARLESEKRKISDDSAAKERNKDDEHQTRIAAAAREKEQFKAEISQLKSLLESERRRLEKERTSEVHHLHAEMIDKLAEKDNAIDVLRQEKDELIRAHDEIIRQMEEDTDREIEDLKELYDKKLRVSEELQTRAQGERKSMENKLVAQTKQMDDLISQRDKAEREKEELRAALGAMQKEVDSLHNEIKERNDTISDKEKRIYDLKKKNQELEKFKFVLNYKIQELKKQVDPKDEEITAAKRQIGEMDEELEKYHSTNQALELGIGDLKLKIEAHVREINSLKNRLKDADVYKQRFKADLHDVVQHIQDPKALKDAVKRVYEKFVKTSQQSVTEEEEEDLQKEYNRQRDYLERTVETLKRKLVKDVEAHRVDNMRIMHENVLLIKEINELRREIKALRLAREVPGEMESTSPVTAGGGSMKTARSSRRLDTVPVASTAMSGVVPTAGGDLFGSPSNMGMGVLDDGEMMAMGMMRPEDDRMRQYRAEIEMQKLEIQRLRQHIELLESKTSIAPRPISRERLPPME